MQIHYRLTALVLTLCQQNQDAYDRLFLNLDRFRQRHVAFMDENLKLVLQLFRKLQKNNLDASMAIRNMGADFHLLNFRELEGVFREFNYFGLRYSSFVQELSATNKNGRLAARGRLSYKIIHIKK